VTIDHRAIAKGRAEAQIALDERRQRLHRGLDVHRLAGAAIHPHMQARQRLHTGIAVARGVVLQEGERQREGFGLDALEARAAEHHIDAVMQDIAPDTVPEQLHGPLVAIGLEHAGAPEFQEPEAAIAIEKAREIVFASRVEIGAGRLGHIRSQQPVGADHLGFHLAEAIDLALAVDNHDVVAEPVIGVDVPPREEAARVRPGAHLVVEHLEAQALAAANVLRRSREAHFEIADPAEDIRHAAGIAHNPFGGVEARDHFAGKAGDRGQRAPAAG